MNSDDAARWDVFISYASEDREAVANPLAELLQSVGLRVWYDQLELKLGDSLLTKIDEGLARCRFGVVVLSESFFSKHFTMRELQGLTQREVDGSKVLLPVWHRISAQRIRELSPSLGDRVAVDTASGVGSVADRILEAVRGEARQSRDTTDAHPPITFASFGRRPSAELEEFAPGRISDHLKDW